MKLLEDRINKDGIILEGNIIKVDSFINHNIDTKLMNELAKEIIRRFEGEEITKVLTIEASGIAIAYAIASILGIDLLFAKKSKTSNLGNDSLLTAKVFSYTHNVLNHIQVNKNYLNSNDKVLVVDDFLANGEAVNGLTSLVYQAGASLVGVAIIIEKGFQDGGKNLREKGIHLESLAIIDSVDNGKVKFR